MDMDTKGEKKGKKEREKKVYKHAKKIKKRGTQHNKPAAD